MITALLRGVGMFGPTPINHTIVVAVVTPTVRTTSAAIEV